MIAILKTIKINPLIAGGLPGSAPPEGTTPTQPV